MLVTERVTRHKRKPAILPGGTQEGDREGTRSHGKVDGKNDARAESQVLQCGEVELMHWDQQRWRKEASKDGRGSPQTKS